MSASRHIPLPVAIYSICLLSLVLSFSIETTRLQPASRSRWPSKKDMYLSILKSPVITDEKQNSHLSKSDSNRSARLKARRFVDAISRRVVVLLPSSRVYEQGLFAVISDGDVHNTAASKHRDTHLQRHAVLARSGDQANDSQPLKPGLPNNVRFVEREDAWNATASTADTSSKNASEAVFSREQTSTTEAITGNVTQTPNTRMQFIATDLMPSDRTLSAIEGNPDWKGAKQEWRTAWELHVYVLGIAFAVLALYSALSMIRLSTEKNLLSRNYFLSLNSLLLMVGVCRSVYFLVDGYNSDGTFPLAVAYLLHNTALPCITSAFSVLFLAILQATKVSLLSDSLQTSNSLTVVMTMHFLFSIGTDVIVGELLHVRLLVLLCQVIFVAWGVVLCCAYIYVFQKVYSTAVRRQQMLKRTLQTKGSDVKGRKRKPRLMLSCAIKVTLVTAMFGLISVALQLYAMIGVYGVYSTKAPEPWPWWTLHFSMGVVELCMCITMSYVATQPLKYRQRTANGSCLEILLLPCGRLLAPGSSSKVVYSIPTQHPETSTVNVGDKIQKENKHAAVINHLTLSALEQRMCGSSVSRAEGATSPTIYETFPKVHLRKKATDDRKQRPRSMLINDKGFIRFRVVGDPDDDIMLTDDEMDSPDDPTPGGGGAGTLTAAGGRGGHSDVDTPVTSPDAGDTDAASRCNVFTFSRPPSIHLQQSIDNMLHMDLSTPPPSLVLRSDSVTSLCADQQLQPQDVQCRCHMLIHENCEAANRGGGGRLNDVTNDVTNGADGGVATGCTQAQDTPAGRDSADTAKNNGTLCNAKQYDFGVPIPCDLPEHRI